MLFVQESKDLGKYKFVISMASYEKCGYTNIENLPWNSTGLKLWIVILYDMEKRKEQEETDFSTS